MQGYTPDSTTETTYAIHWLTASWRGDLITATEQLTAWLGAYEDTERGGFGYRWSRRFLSGAVLYSDFLLPHMTLVVSGDACDVIPVHLLVDVMRSAIDSGGKVTRLDVALDHCPFEPSDIWAAVPLMTTKLNRSSFRFIQSRDGRSDTVQLGSRTSERYARVYNRRGFTRFELELKRLQAMRAARLLIEAYAMVKDIGAAIRSEVLGLVVIAAEWWDDFIGLGVKLAAVRTVAEVTLGKARHWVSHQVGAVLAAVNQYDPAILEWCIADGRTKKSFARYLTKFTINE